MPSPARSAPVSALLLGAAVLAVLAGSFLFDPALARGEGGQIVLSRPWARLRANPRETSRSVAIVYGNDVLTVLETKDGWSKVRAVATPAKPDGTGQADSPLKRGSKGRAESAAKRGGTGRADIAVGWLSPTDAGDAGPPTAPSLGTRATGSTVAGSAPTAAPAPLPRPGSSRRPPTADMTLPPPPPVGGSPASPDTLRRMGYDEAARRKLTEILLRERRSPVAYLATRDMLTYYPVGDLPPLQGGRIPPGAAEQADSLRVSVLLQEGQALVRAGKSWDAVFLYQAMVQNDPNSGRAYLELLDLLTRIMTQAVNSPNMENLGLATSIWRNTYPDLPLPQMVQELSRKKK